MKRAEDYPALPPLQFLLRLSCAITLVPQCCTTSFAHALSLKSFAKAAECPCELKSAIATSNKSWQKLAPCLVVSTRLIITSLITTEQTRASSPPCLCCKNYHAPKCLCHNYVNHSSDMKQVARSTPAFLMHRLLCLQLQMPIKIMRKIGSTVSQLIVVIGGSTFDHQTLSRCFASI